MHIIHWLQCILRRVTSKGCKQPAGYKSEFLERSNEFSLFRSHELKRRFESQARAMILLCNPGVYQRKSSISVSSTRIQILGLLLSILDIPDVTSGSFIR